MAEQNKRTKQSGLVCKSQVQAGAQISNVLPDSMQGMSDDLDNILHDYVTFPFSAGNSQSSTDV